MTQGLKHLPCYDIMWMIGEKVKKIKKDKKQMGIYLSDHAEGLYPFNSVIQELNILFELNESAMGSGINTDGIFEMCECSYDESISNIKFKIPEDMKDFKFYNHPLIPLGKLFKKGEWLIEWSRDCYEYNYDGELFYWFDDDMEEINTYKIYSKYHYQEQDNYPHKDFKNMMRNGWIKN